jgi:hypothetical protein
MIVPATIFSLLICFYLYRKYNISRHKYKFKDGSEIPGPTPNFLLGNLLDVAAEQVTSSNLILNRNQYVLANALEKWRRQYGDIFQFWMVDKAVLFVQDYEVIKQISNSKDTMGRLQTDVQLMINENKGIIGTNDPEHHKIHRSGNLGNSK